MPIRVLRRRLFYSNYLSRALYENGLDGMVDAIAEARDVEE